MRDQGFMNMTWRQRAAGEEGGQGSGWAAGAGADGACCGTSCGTVRWLQGLRPMGSQPACVVLQLCEPPAPPQLPPSRANRAAQRASGGGGGGPELPFPTQPPAGRLGASPGR